MSLKRRFCECTTRFLPHYVFHNFLCSLSCHRLSMQNTHAKNTSGLSGLKQKCTQLLSFDTIFWHSMSFPCDRGLFCCDCWTNKHHCCLLVCRVSAGAQEDPGVVFSLDGNCNYNQMRRFKIDLSLLTSL